MTHCFTAFVVVVFTLHITAASSCLDPVKDSDDKRVDALVSNLGERQAVLDNTGACYDTLTKASSHVSEIQKWQEYKRRCHNSNTGQLVCVLKNRVILEMNYAYHKYRLAMEEVHKFCTVHTPIGGRLLDDGDASM